MKDEIEVINSALLHLGPDLQVTSRSDTSKEGRVANLRFDNVRDSVLRAGYWNFAVARAELVVDPAAEPPFDYSYAYTLPTDPYCLKVLSVVDGDNYDWSVEGRRLVTNLTEAKITYTARVVDVEQWDSLFAEAMTLKLAWAIAQGLKAKSTLIKSLWEQYEIAEAEAMGMDAQEGSVKVLDASDWLDARNSTRRIARGQ